MALCFVWQCTLCLVWDSDASECIWRASQAEPPGIHFSWGTMKLSWKEFILMQGRFQTHNCFKDPGSFDNLSDRKYTVLSFILSCWGWKILSCRASTTSKGPLFSPTCTHCAFQTLSREPCASGLTFPSSSPAVPALCHVPLRFWLDRSDMRHKAYASHHPLTLLEVT